jgi:hypothetical protein
MWVRFFTIFSFFLLLIIGSCSISNNTPPVIEELKNLDTNDFYLYKKIQIDKKEFKKPYIYKPRKKIDFDRKKTITTDKKKELEENDSIYQFSTFNLPNIFFNPFEINFEAYCKKNI